MAETAKSKLQPYQVVSRRYRPRAFGELIGQPQITQALTKAIQQDRVGHAYLFTGARGTGKTSTARIFAKCLNCAQGPTTTPCLECDSCLGIATGEDLDVIEIDGASNRGIDEIRQLRSNVAIRPSRSRFKIYIIDEVHMLTPQAFNALLKTLEEPPGHVKFFFCTTDPQKVPITVLSRCQRYDFMPVETPQIVASLERIAAQENIVVERDALELLARRAAGSLRDSQSLFEQLLSFCTDRIGLQDVLSLLGIADSQRVLNLATRMVDRDIAGALAEIDRAIQEGIEVGQLAQQLVGLFRDAIVLKVGCDPSVLLHIVGDGVASLRALVERASLDQWMAHLQIVDQALTKMQTSLHGRILLEAACVRICQLEQLRPIQELLGHPAAAAASLTPRETPPSPVATAPALPAVHAPKPSARQETLLELDQVSDATALAPPKKKEELISPTTQASPSVAIESDPVTLWHAVIARIGGVTTSFVSQFESVIWSEDNQLRVELSNEYNCQMCNRPERKDRLEAVLRELTGRTVRIDFRAASGRGQPHAAAVPKRASRRQLQQQLEKHPLVKRAIELFDADVIDFQLGRKKPQLAEEPNVESETVEEATNHV